MTAVWVVVSVAAVAWAVMVYNRLVHLRNQVQTAWADIDVQLTRRHALVPQLVSAVRGYAGHERSVLETVTELRAQALAATTPARLGDVEASLGSALTRLLALREAYPDLKASDQFLQLQSELVEVEEHLQYARRFYNGAVRDYHTAMQRLPDVLIARAFGFTEREFFQADADARDAVTVDLAR